MQAGDLDQRVAFDASVSVPDGHGGTETGWAQDDVATKVAANFRYLRGGEAVLAARLDGRQPVVVTVRRSSKTRLIDTNWRMRDVRTGIVYNIRSGPVPTDDRGYLEFTVESGVAV
ncbi:head-tail adaptor protein [Neorhizobium sp. JUb45]|uniref:head-tail adaptor protein n=1 Tax=Neorhizobium sp. JUb45 TaxID=2485113 RepID=UPI0010488A21|nr:head-tail adaptor protein [Neorhizobium sp. JUb45]TCR01069.1 head-tail joining protein [Neorhizobium sp. JUb45]